MYKESKNDILERNFLNISFLFFLKYNHVYFLQRMNCFVKMLFSRERRELNLVTSKPNMKILLLT